MGLEVTKINQLKKKPERTAEKFRFSQSPSFKKRLHMDSLVAHKAKDLVSLMFKEASKTKIY